MLACGQLAMQAHVSGVTIIPPGPDTKLAAEIAHSLQVVQASRTNVGRLGGNANARARQAKGIARMESEAATTLKQLATPVRYRQVVHQVATALVQEATAFTALAGAASAQKRSAYPSSVTQVVAASRGVADATRPAGGGLPAHVPSLRVLSLDRSLPETPPTPTTSTKRPSQPQRPSSHNDRPNHDDTSAYLHLPATDTAALPHRSPGPRLDC